MRLRSRRLRPRGGYLYLPACKRSSRRRRSSRRNRAPVARVRGRTLTPTQTSYRWSLTAKCSLRVPDNSISVEYFLSLDERPFAIGYAHLREVPLFPIYERAASASPWGFVPRRRLRSGFQTMQFRLEHASARVIRDKSLSGAQPGWVYSFCADAIGHKSVGVVRADWDSGRKSSK